MTTLFEDDLEELSSAEDFLEYFKVDYDAKTVQVNRLHILQRFHDYLSQAQESMPNTDEAKREVYFRLLTRAYNDFVESDALTEKVFKVFHMHEPQETFVPLNDVFK
ncbi:nitrogenase-stabilizing/protective protein NifW [Beggiatoa leptomitoformis]|uniref:Nitrogenase-stabilizing/protective protein NifW n=1 Tax=Beggiatoa leptomitoformis TaxID=288004 RepID=A0A2N9YG13_9GAMM|nr:nitrogenase-stabilizing/protective protein NifW [Beggiatoa leptomitoformis]ALG68356.1 nitrogen fixation protein NifW [Beggiatoa leptomitoformis]AUI69325.1 nitrogen fixation protein NifW [Beggiatoa leptomitoformis]